MSPTPSLTTSTAGPHPPVCNSSLQRGYLSSPGSRARANPRAGPVRAPYPTQARGVTCLRSSGPAAAFDRGRGMAKDFRAFLLRGNVVDLAVGIVIGAAFGAVVTALVRDLITPIVAAILGKPDFSALSFAVNGSTFHYGDFINAVLAFLSIAAAVFYFVVRPVNALMARRRTQPDIESETAACPECLSDIPRRARRCAFCTSPQIPSNAAGANPEPAR